VSTHAVVTTSGGALAIRCLTTDETMHPGVGPLVEADALYVRQSRLAERLAEGKVVLFDVGLGAGSNALAARAVVGEGGALEIVSYERDLGALRLALEHPAGFGLDGEAGEAARALLETGRHVSARTTWTLRHGELLEALAAETARADIVYWDPFSPKANPELWTIAAFAAIRRVAGPRATLFTYSASTATRVALLLGGWAVGVGASIGSKAQTTAAAVRIEDLAQPLPASWVARLARADAPLPRDAPPDVAARVAALPQFARDREP
jgi:queuine tRNA-ribosyltransferase